MSARHGSKLQALGHGKPYIRFEGGGPSLGSDRKRQILHLGQDIVVPDFEKRFCVLIKLYNFIWRLPVEAEVENHLFVEFGGKQKGKNVLKRTISGWLVMTILKVYELKGKPL